LQCVQVALNSNYTFDRSHASTDIHNNNCGRPALVNQRLFSDVTMKVKDQEFLVHRVILATQSEVFRAMFNHDWVEKNTNCITINDVEPDVMLDLVTFLYTGAAPNLSEHAGTHISSMKIKGLVYIYETF